jgi:lycopene cyclase domain-containing protein
VTTYLLLALGVLVPVATVSLLVLLRAGRAALTAALVAVAVLVVATAVFDSVIVGTGIVGYDRARILGARIGTAPVEDFAYPIAAGLALPALWHVLGRRRRRP